MTNLNLLKIIIESIKNDKEIFDSQISLKSIIKFFQEVKSNYSRFNYAYLHFYLYKHISEKTVAKRKTTSRDFEDILATIFNGKITDEEKRDNSNSINFFLENETITGFALSNKREKADIKISPNYLLSVKTLMANNKEINFGSLEKTTLFSGFGIENKLTERKGSNSENIGLGSKPRLFNLLEKINE